MLLVVRIIAAGVVDICVEPSDLVVVIAAVTVVVVAAVVA